MTRAAPIDLDQARLAAALAARIPGFAAPVSFRATTGSTNDDAKEAAAAGAPALSVFVADAQTAGRGRGGRTWHSPPGVNLHLSLVLRPGWDPAVAAPFALVVGLAVAEVIDARLAAPRARVKWPNDVLVDDRKIAGVLLEAAVGLSGPDLARGGRLKSLIVGVGLDVHGVDFPPELAGGATSLALQDATGRDRAALAADVVERVARAADLFGERGLQPFLGSLRARDALQGRTVRIDGAPGVARGLDETGRLLVERDGGSVDAVLAGHVEL